MVYISQRKAPVCVQPNEPTRTICLSKYLNKSIASIAQAPGHIASFDGLGWFDAPPELSRLGVVIQDFTQTFSGKRHTGNPR
jgi:hypothetical protein